VEKWTLQHRPEDVQRMLQAAGVGAGLVASARDLDEDPQMNHYNFYRELDHPFMSRLRYYHPAPIKLSAVATAVQRPVLLGEHTERICMEILGMPKDEVDRLRRKGVFE
jgi:benzylsuccinate CoA-transferase BbsF subunit